METNFYAQLRPVPLGVGICSGGYFLAFAGDDYLEPIRDQNTGEVILYPSPGTVEAARRQAMRVAQMIARAVHTQEGRGDN